MADRFYREPVSIVQGSDEWHAARLGDVTASRIDAVMAKGKGGAPSKTRATYMGELIAERLSGIPYPHFQSAAMQHGTETEAEARAAYAMLRDPVEQTGYVQHPHMDRTGASPDGLVGETGLVEFKCPNSSTHIATLRGAKIDRGYLLQMQWQMACTGRRWCDFVSYDPRIGADHCIAIQRVSADHEWIGDIEDEVQAFLVEMDEAIADLNRIAA